MLHRPRGINDGGGTWRYAGGLKGEGHSMALLSDVEGRVITELYHQPRAAFHQTGQNKFTFEFVTRLFCNVGLFRFKGQYRSETILSRSNTSVINQNNHFVLLVLRKSVSRQCACHEDNTSSGSLGY